MDTFDSEDFQKVFMDSQTKDDEEEVGVKIATPRDR